MESTITGCGTLPEIHAEQDDRGGMEVLAGHFQSLYAAVYDYLLHRLFDRELADELTAETFYRAVRAMGHFRGNVRQLRVWLLRTATNLANTRCRRQRLWRLVFRRLQEARNPVEAGEPDTDDGRAQRVRAALSALAPRDQAVVVMRYFMDMSFEEIAAVLGCRQENVRVRLSRVVKALRRRLGVSDEDET